MKRILSASLLAACIALAGCGTASTNPNPLLTPAALTEDVSAATAISLELYPQATPDVALARDVICREVSKTNTSPDAIVADIQALGLTNLISKVIINVAILAYRNVLRLIGTDTATTLLPYEQALCDGLMEALPPAGTARTERRKPLPPHLK